MTRNIPLVPIREWARLQIGPTPGPSMVTRNEADALLKAAAAHPLARDEGANILWEHRGQLRTRQMVGVIAAGACVLEILPKVDPDLSNDGADLGGLRGQLAAMLDVAYDLEIGAGAAAAMAREAKSLLDLLIRMFANRLLAETRRGLPRLYLAMAEDLPRLRGRLDVARQFTVHAVRPDRLACRFDELTHDTALMQVMKAAVVLCDRHSRSAETRRRLAELRFVLVGVRDVPRAALPWQAVQIDRTSRRWQGLLKLARLLLGRAWQDTRATAAAPEGMALLFPMNELFEAWVTALLRRALVNPKVGRDSPLVGVEVVAQGGRRFCLGPWRPSADCAADAFQTKPDLILRRGGRVLAIIDTKWKRLPDPPVGAKKGVSQADVYQMMAYARLYACDRLLLLYPAAPAEPAGIIHRFGIDRGREMLALGRIDCALPVPDAISRLRAIVSDLFGAAPQHVAHAQCPANV